MTPINDNVIAFPIKKSKPQILDSNDIENLAMLFVSALEQVNEIPLSDNAGQHETSHKPLVD